MKVSSSSTFETRTASYLSKSRRRFNAHKKSHTNTFLVQHTLVTQQPSADTRLQMLAPPTSRLDNCNSKGGHSNSLRTIPTNFAQRAVLKTRHRTASLDSLQCIARAHTSTVRGKRIGCTAWLLSARRVLSRLLRQDDSTKLYGSMG